MANPITPNKLLIMDIKSTLGENIKLYRKEKHLSQEQLSEKIDISVKHLSAIERGLTFVSAELLEKLSLSLKIPVHQFFQGKTDIILNDLLLENIDRIIEKHLVKTIENIKMEIRQANK